MLNVPDLATLARFLSGTDTNSLTNANLLILFNDALDRIHGQILTETAGGKWPYGDTNYSAFPSYTQTMTDSEPFYQFDTEATGTYPSRYEPLVILGVEVQDNNGNWHKLDPISLKEIHQSGTAQSEFYETDGLPLYYEKREHGLVLYPAPATANVTLTDGLRIFYLRNAEQLDDVTTTTVFPGIPSPWHSFLAYDAALVYCGIHKSERVSFIMARLQEREQGILRFIANRNPDDTHAITVKTKSFR